MSKGCIQQLLGGVDCILSPLPALPFPCEAVIAMDRVSTARGSVTTACFVEKSDRALPFRAEGQARVLPLTRVILCAGRTLGMRTAGMAQPQEIHG